METLTKTFSSVAHHMLSPTMIIMMAVMALPALSFAAPGSVVTLGDWGLSLLDHYLTMFTAPFTELETIGEVVSNTFQGEIMPGSYEIGNAHAGHGLAAADTLTQTFTSRSEWWASLPEFQQNTFMENAAFTGESIEDFTIGWNGPNGQPLPTNWN